jgi:hypothetical protein
VLLLKPPVALGTCGAKECALRRPSKDAETRRWEGFERVRIRLSIYLLFQFMLEKKTPKRVCA